MQFVTDFFLQTRWGRLLGQTYVSAHYNLKHNPTNQLNQPVNLINFINLSTLSSNQLYQPINFINLSTNKKNQKNKFFFAFQIMSKDKLYKRINILNKKASFEFQLLTKYTAGMVLGGTEVKSIKAGNASITEAYCFYQNDELYIRNMNIGSFKQGSFSNHEPLAVRKLLLKKVELKKLQKRGDEKGFSIVPLKLFEAENGFIKIEIALAQGKKAFDKRDSIKERDVERNLRRKDE